jgi:predicted TIM-barrel fold metal-dependent hydrolase
MIIDFHTHVIREEWLPREWWNAMAESAYRRHQDSPFPQKKEECYDALKRYHDPEGERLIEAMDKAGVKKSIILPLDFSFDYKTGESIMEQNRVIARIQKRYPDRLAAFVGIDPRRKDAPQIATSLIQDFGCTGVKLYPPTGFHINDPSVFRLLDEISKSDVPIVFHTGFAFTPFKSLYCSLEGLEEICDRYPHLTVVAAHLGGGSFDQLCWIAMTRSNLYADFSSCERLLMRCTSTFVQMIKKALCFFGYNHILFGSDFPFSQTALGHKELIAKIRKELLESSVENISNFEYDAIMGQNAQRILKGE